jgi:tetratricopeptide (TPR) repeat protein
MKAGFASLLRGVCLLGFAVSLVFAGGVLFLSLEGGIPLLPPPRKTSFVQALEDYDKKMLADPDLPPRQRNALLDSLEKKTLGTENILSVLKRRRTPAFQAPVERDQVLYQAAYIQAAGRARRLYPYSGQVGALAAEALVLKSPGRILNDEGAAELRDLTILMNQGALQNLALAFSVYSGAMGDPASARFLPRELFSLICAAVQGEERERYLVNSCIRTLLEGDTREALAMVNSLFDSGEILREDTSRFGGEFFYDHGNFLRAAELFSLFGDDRSLARQGDALWLAGFTGSARELWRAAAASEPAGPAPSQPGGALDTDPAAVRARSLYNLASSAASAEEEGRWLERLFAAGGAYPPGRIFGVIRYSRLSPAERALFILEQAGSEEGLFDLEALRRRSKNWTVDRTVAETWLLLNRHPQDGRLFEWAAWYFDFQRRYEETALALRNAGINRVEGPWALLHRAFAQVRENSLGEAEKTLRSISPGSGAGETWGTGGRRGQPLWQASANLGLLLDLRRSPQEALQYYETAAGLLAAGGSLLKDQPGIPAAGLSPERRDAARVQLRIARCLKTLGREPESRRVLEYALDLDPENLEARIELRRLSVSRSIL